MTEQQFTALLHEHQGILHKICRLYQDQREDREDLFQEITYQLWKAMPGFRGQAKLSTFIYRVALNTALTQFKKKRPAVTYYEQLPAVTAVAPDDEQTEQRERLFTALKQLSDGEKALVTLYLEAVSIKEMAEIMGITENNVSVKMNRVKNKLQRILR